LGAQYLIDGSVRKAGDQVRITAQLVQADNGVSIWTDSYDREIKNIFATQSDIATAIAGALRLPLGLQQGESLVSNRTIDTESYQQYLRARALFRARSIDQVIAMLEPVVARDPNYAPAWALLAQTYVVSSAFNTNFWAGSVVEARNMVQSALGKAEMAAREAIRLDPRQAGAYVALSRIKSQQGNWVASDDLYRQALALDADDPDVLQLYAVTLASVGRFKQALSVREQLRTLEPFVPVFNVFHAATMLLDGQNGAATSLLEATPAGGEVNYFRNYFLAKAFAAAGRYDEAAGTLLAIPANTRSLSRRSVEDAARLLRSAPKKADAPGGLPALEGLGFVYAHVGAEDRLMETPEYLLEVGYPDLFQAWVVWEPQNVPLRKTERFKAFVRKAGLLDYWRAKGWPDLCRPQGADDFECD
jgi:adenylate cyclase